MRRGNKKGTIYNQSCPQFTTIIIIILIIIIIINQYN